MPKNEKYFECEFCALKFRKADHLSRHIRGQHTFQRPYACTICDKSFSRSDVLRRHIKGTHGEEAAPEATHRPTSSNSPPPPSTPSPEVSAASSLDALRNVPLNDMYYQTNNYAQVTQPAYTQPADEPTALPQTDQSVFNQFHAISPANENQPLATTSAPPIAADGRDQALSVDPLMQDLGTSPLAELWDSSLFDFGQLFRSPDADPYLANVQLPLNELCIIPSSADRLAQIWPTRPSRRSQEVKPTDLIDPRSRTYRSLDLDQATLARMHRHLTGGGIPFGRDLPTADALSELLHLYFEHWNTLWPMLHEPTFDANRTSALLLLNMCGIGAIFLSTREGDELAAAIMNKMHESLSFCMSAQLDKYEETVDQDILQLCQAYMLRQLYWLVAGDRNQLESTMLFHSIVASMSRRAGVFSEISPVPDTHCELLPHDIEIEWRYWAAKEIRRRTALCFIVNDLTFSTLFMQPAMASIGNVNWSLPTDDRMFTASTALEWKRLYQQSILMQKSPPLHDLSSLLFSREPESLFAMYGRSKFSTHILVASILSVVLSTRVTRTDLDEELLKRSFAHNPVLKSLHAAWTAILSLDQDTCFSQVTWHSAWMHLTTDIRVIEVACGREGTDAATAASRQVSEWANGPLGRRSVLHAVSVLQQVKSGAIGIEAPPHLYIALYQSGLLIYCFSKFAKVRKDAMVPKDVDWAQCITVGFAPAATNDDVPPAAEAWTMHGTEAASGIRLSRILPEIQQVLTRIGYTKLRQMLNEVIENILEVDKENLNGNMNSIL